MSKKEILDRRELLQSTFNKLPEKSINGNCSIDEDLIEFMIFTRPDLDIVFSTVPDRSSNPTKIYENAIRMLADFEDSDIIKIVSAYLPGKFWDELSSDEKSKFVIQTITDFEQTLADKKNNEKKKKTSEKIGKVIEQSSVNPLKIAIALHEEIPIYYDPWRNYWMWDADCRCYKRIDETEIMVQISESMDFTVFRSKVKSEILEAIRNIGRRMRVQETPKNWIHFQDRVVDIETLDEFEPSKEWFFSAPIPHRYGKSEETPIIDALFDSWVGDKKDLLYEICAYCMVDDYPIHRIFALVGTGRNGKSVFSKLVRRLIGNENCISTDLERLSRTQFEASKLYKKKVAFVSETNYTTLTKTNTLKAMTGDDVLSCEFKGKDPFDFTSHAKVIIGTNNLPSTTDRTDGFYRRWITIPFRNEFQEGADPLKNIPEEEYENLCRKCIRILKDVLDRGSFSHEGTIEERREKYENLSNPVQAFVNEYCSVDLDGFIPIWYLYDRFDEYREHRGHRKISKDEFSKTLKGMGFELDMKSYNFDRQKLYTDNPKPGMREKWRSALGITLKDNKNGITGITGITVSKSISYIYNRPYFDDTDDTADTVEENNNSIEELTEMQRLDRLIIKFVKEVYHMIVPDEYEFERAFCKEYFVYKGSLVRERMTILRKRGWRY